MSVNLDAVLVKERVVPEDFTSGHYIIRIVDWSVRKPQGWVEITCEIVKTAKAKAVIATIPHILFNDKDVQHLQACMFYRQFGVSGKKTTDFLNSLKGSTHRVFASLEAEDDRYPVSDTNREIIRLDFNSKHKK